MFGVAIVFAPLLKGELVQLPEILPFTICWPPSSNRRRIAEERKYWKRPLADLSGFESSSIGRPEIEDQERVVRKPRELGSLNEGGSDEDRLWSSFECRMEASKLVGLASTNSVSRLRFGRKWLRWAWSIRPVMNVVSSKKTVINMDADLLDILWELWTVEGSNEMKYQVKTDCSVQLNPWWMRDEVWPPLFLAGMVKVFDISHSGRFICYQWSSLVCVKEWLGADALPPDGFDQLGLPGRTEW